jgi:hypothetical protein
MTSPFLWVTPERYNSTNPITSSQAIEVSANLHNKVTKSEMGNPNLYLFGIETTLY